ncbi:MAG: Ty1/Copia family ribonuclease HI, partial [Cohaesibacter sp.]|nr:Ty1/Copia family ribonuclease HI [Cohaesibacter sp.]
MAHAFMHSPIPKKECIVLQLPQSVSLEDGSLAYLVLYRALNGLRDASLAWLNLLSESIKSVGLITDDMEPCIYQGCIQRKGKHIGSAILIAYVDDLLLCSDSDDVEKVVEDTIGAVVPLKETGRIKKAREGGGSLIFIGRHIFRDGHKDDLKLGVDPKFLDTVFKEYNISKSSQAIPDVAAHIEKTVDDTNAQIPLSQEAYSRFRRALGKLLWMAQVRHDIKLYLSLIGSQQAAPMAGTEAAIRAILRYLHGDMNTMLSIPSGEYFTHACPGWDEVGVVHAFSDASHAPYRFNGRRSITGGAIFVEGTLIKTTAKQQQSVALSSCEAELYALQAVSQEAIALAAFCTRIYSGLEECAKDAVGYTVMESDSESALTLIAGKDVPKRSRHIEIRLHWMRNKIEVEELAIKYKPGTDNCADMFAKCLGTRDFLRHRTVLGFAQHEVPINDLNSLRDTLLTGVSAGPGQEMAFIEVCCSPNSALR